MIHWKKSDGGRKEAGFKGDAGDCVVRAIAIATEKPYADVYRELGCHVADYACSHRDRVARRIRERGVSVRDGVSRKVYEQYLASIGWVFVPCMSIGSGCRVHLRSNELPNGRIIVRLSRHLAAVVDGVLYDTHDCSRDGTRCVYGYFVKG